MQGYDTWLNGQLELNASVRYDRNNVFGGITTPRLNLLWHHADDLSSRFAIGRGFRLPTRRSSSSNTRSWRPRGRLQPPSPKSRNLSYALNYADDRLAVTASLNHTRIDDMALFIDDTANSGNFLLQPARSPFTVDNADVVGTWQVTPASALTVGLEKYRYRFESTDFAHTLFARPDYRVTLGLDHDSGPWDLNVRATYTGPQDLAVLHLHRRASTSTAPKLTQPGLLVRRPARVVSLEPDGLCLFRHRQRLRQSAIAQGKLLVGRPRRQPRRHAAVGPGRSAVAGVKLAS